MPIFCIILTSSSYIDVIKTVHKPSNNILIGVPVGTAASRDETPCIKSTHNTIAVLRPCRLNEKSHKCYKRRLFHNKNFDRLYAYQGNMAGVCFGPATRPLMLQYYPRWKATSTQRTSVLMYGVLLESSLSADWSNVPRVILDMYWTRAIRVQNGQNSKIKMKGRKTISDDFV